MVSYYFRIFSTVSKLFLWLFILSFINILHSDKLLADTTNLALHKIVHFNASPSYSMTHDRDDIKQLTDGKLAVSELMWYDKAAVGWLNTDPVIITIDLEQATAITGIALHIAAGKSGINWPEKINISVSNDGKQFTFVEDLMQLLDKKIPEGYSVQWLSTDKLKTHGKYIKLEIIPQGPYVFIDEIKFYGQQNGKISATKNIHRSANANLALHKTVHFNASPSYSMTHDSDDIKQLTDGKLAVAELMWYDKAAVGWLNTDPVIITIDLEQATAIKGVALHMAGGKNGINWPAKINISVSNDGKQFTLVGDLMQLLDKKIPEGYSVQWLSTDKLKTHGKYIKLEIIPQGPYAFIDEIKLYRGDDQWLNKPLTKIDIIKHWEADFAKITWQEKLQAIAANQRPTQISIIDGSKIIEKKSCLQQVITTAKNVKFTFHGEASKLRKMSWIGTLKKNISVEKSPYAVLAFKANGISWSYHAEPLVELHGFNVNGGIGKVILLEANMIMNDGLTHTIIKKLPVGFVVQEIKVNLVSKDDQPYLKIKQLKLTSKLPLIFNQEIINDHVNFKAGFVPVNLKQVLNSNAHKWFETAFTKHKTLLDGISSLTAGNYFVSGIPFKITSDSKNIATLTKSPKDDSKIDFRHQKIAVKNLIPKSPDDLLSIDLDIKAREAFFLILLDLPPVQKRGAVVSCATHLDDIETISIELIYENNERERAFPYSLGDRGSYISAREMGAYAVELDPTKRLKKIILHNNHNGGARFALAGLTLNTSETVVVPQLAEIIAPQKVHENVTPTMKTLQIYKKNKTLIFENRWYRYTFDLSQGFRIKHIENRWNESSKINLSPISGLAIRIGNNIYTGRSFKAQLLEITATKAEIKLTGLKKELPIEIYLTISAENTGEIKFNSQIKNNGSQIFKGELCLPALSNVTIDNNSATRIFFPQYRMVDTAKNIALRSPYGIEFTSQFMDIYNRQSGTGLMIRTDNKQQQFLEFTLNKANDGVSGGVCFSHKSNQIAPGEIRKYIPISIITHNGDWHNAFNLYRQWLNSWYKPVNSQDKKFFINAWDLRVLRPSVTISKSDARVPSIITPDRKEFLIKDTFDFDKKLLGHIPDIVHCFNWNYNDKKERAEWALFSTPNSYNQVGGLPFFKKGINEIQTKWQTPVSLYTILDRFRASSIPDKTLRNKFIDRSCRKILDNDESAALRGSDTKDGIFSTEHGDMMWLEYVLDDIVKMQKETGCQMIYIDVFPHFSHYKMKNDANPRIVDLNVIKYLRKYLPSNVAIWSEYALTDYASQYADGYHHYYFMDLHQIFARKYNQPNRTDGIFMQLPINIGRYATPKYKSVGIPHGIEGGEKPSQVDALFMNGEVFLENTWRLHNSRIRTKINRAYKIKHKYTECFNSPNAMPLVNTAVEGIAANFFPSDKRKLWTIYNGRPKTYSGTVLRIPHYPGAKYIDAWNEKIIKPKIENGFALVTLSIDPQQMGCIVQE